MQESISSLKKTARISGILYLAVAITAAYAIMFVPGQTIIRGDNLGTAKSIIDKEDIFRSGIASHLISVILFLFLAISLYRLLKSVDQNLARQMLMLVVVQIPIVFLIEVCKFSSLMVLKGNIFSAFSSEQVRDLSMLFLKIHTYGMQFVEIFWGLWLIPFGQLVIRSRFIPKLLGILLIIGGIAYTIDSLTCILLPSYREFTNIPALAFSALAEISMILWFLIKGVKDHISIGVVEKLPKITPA